MTKKEQSLQKKKNNTDKENHENHNNIIAVVLAAGQGKRMQSNLPKVAHLLAQKPLLQWTIDSLLDSKIENIVCVISKNPLISEIIEKNTLNQKHIYSCLQETALGTGHAVSCAISYIDSLNIINPHTKNVILVAYGDTPAVQPETYKKFYEFHVQSKNDLSTLVFKTENPFGYGRILLSNKDGKFVGIREEKDCTSEEKKITLCNSGLVCGNLNVLKEILPKLTNNNSNSEYYLTDIFEFAQKLGFKIDYMQGDTEKEFCGINTPEQLKEMAKYLNV